MTEPTSTVDSPTVVLVHRAVAAVTRGPVLAG